MNPEDIAAANEQLLRAYHVVFGSPDGQAVLIDLVSFCRGAETVAALRDPRDPNSRVDFERTLMLIGRRDVLLRIQDFSKLTFEEVQQLRLGRINVRGET